jgi:hypothetical protein
MDWLDSPPCGGSYLQQQDACGELASFSDFAVCDAAVLCERDGAMPLPPPPPPPPSPTPSSPTSPTHPPLPPPPPPPVAPPPPPPLPPPLPPPPPWLPPPPPSPSPSSPTPPSLSPLPSSPPALPVQLGPTSLPLPTKHYRQRASQNISAAPHLWSSALLAASCAAFVVFTCLVMRRRFPRRDAMKGATKVHSDEKDADANGGLLTPQRTRWLWAVHLRRWLSRTISPTRAVADDQRLVARGSESSAAITGAVTRAQTLAEMHGLD